MNQAASLLTRRLERCLACGETRLREMALAYEFGGQRFPLVSCPGCGIRFLAVQPRDESLAELYGGDYFEGNYRCGRVAGRCFEEHPFLEENRGLLEAFEALGPPGRLLEVGCAAGWLLGRAAERGWRAQGVEPARSAAEFARARGLDVFHGDLTAARLPAATFDLVYMGDVLEHVPDCRAVLAEVERLLKPGGHLYLRGPITTHSLARRLGLALYGAFGRTILLREPPYHLWEFTPRSLAGLARAAGLEVVRMRQSKIPPGGLKSRERSVQRAVMAALDLVNLPITRLFNAWGDRLVLVARKPA